jgi:SWI/SNF-related matrix-associated actin-dependent regulator 1 of chromatin subfamily A
MQWVLDFLDSGRKLLLFAWHRDVVDLIHMALKDYSPAKIYGGMSNQDREAMRQKFITDPACRVMVANIQSGGVGIDGFQEVCSDVAFAEFSHTPNYHRQAEDRLHRSGQHNSVTSYYLVAPGTVDMDAIEVLDDRAKMLDGVLDGKEAADIDLLTELLERRGLKRAAG